MTEIGEGAATQLKEIGYFRVTERKLDSYEKYCHIESNNIAQESVVVDIGSGWNQELSAGLENLDKGIKTISLDASLAIPPKGIDGVTYSTWRENKLVDVDENMQKERLALTRENSVAAIVPDLPLKNGVADLIVDCYGPATYLDDEKIVEYISEIGRVLKNNGEAHLYPIDNFDDFVLKDEEDRCVVSGDRRLELSREVAKNGGLIFEKYLQDDETGSSRVGLVIKKEAVIKDKSS